MHARRLAQQHVHRHVDRRRLALAGHHQIAVVADRANHGERAALPLAQPLEGPERRRRDRQRITLLRLVAPDLQRAHAAFLDRDAVEREARTAAARVGDLRHRVGQAARADVVDAQYRIVRAERPAAIDDFLRAPLDLGVAALDRIEIELLGVGPCAHAGRRTAAQADAHAGAAELDQQRAGRQVELGGLVIADAADATGDHDRLVVAVAPACHIGLERAEIAEQVRAAELVVEGRRAQRAVDHDRQRTGDPRRIAIVRVAGRRLRDVGIALPRPLGLRQPQMRDGKTAKAGLGLRPPAGRALIADLAAGAGGCPRKR